MSGCGSARGSLPADARIGPGGAVRNVTQNGDCDLAHGPSSPLVCCLSCSLDKLLLGGGGKW